jgi:cytidine deaminase
VGFADRFDATPHPLLFGDAMTTPLAWSPQSDAHQVFTQQSSTLWDVAHHGGDLLTGQKALAGTPAGVASALLKFPAVSGYPVGALALGKSGRTYGGINVEFPALGYGGTIHAEQFAVALAWHAGESQLTHLASTSSPCGHCRQFLMELGNPGLLVTTVEGGNDSHWVQASLTTLLPNAFTLANPGSNLLSPHNPPAALTTASEQSLKGLQKTLATLALQAFNRSYAPATPTEQCGLALKLKDSDTIYTGALLESSAYNPSLNPLTVALIGILADGKDPATIERGVFVGRPDARWDMLGLTKMWTSLIAPGADIQRVEAEIVPSPQADKP